MNLISFFDYRTLSVLIGWLEGFLFLFLGEKPSDPLILISISDGIVGGYYLVFWQNMWILNLFSAVPQQRLLKPKLLHRRVKSRSDGRSCTLNAVSHGFPGKFRR